MRKKVTDIGAEIQRLSVSKDLLKQAWQSILRKPFPDHLPRHLVIGIVAWHLQAHHSGGFSRDEEKYLADVAATPSSRAVERYGKPEGRHQSGTVFVREHDGVVHKVTRTEGGYRWQGRDFTSLSAVAFAITGTNWNGPRFFGVKGSSEKRCAGK
jgi:hypothetical protein